MRIIIEMANDVTLYDFDTFSNKLKILLDEHKHLIKDVKMEAKR